MPAQVARWTAPLTNPFKGVDWTLGFVGFIGYVWIIHQGVTPLGELFVGMAILGVVTQRYPFRAPVEYWVHTAYLTIAGLATFVAVFKDPAQAGWVEYVKINVIFLIACNVIRTPQQLRAFIVIFLLLVARYPVRGAMLNYLGGITTAGRVAWNFSFANPNDLAGLCLVPIALCAGLLVTERKKYLVVGSLGLMALLVMTVGVTQSRGGILALGSTLGLILLYKRPTGKQLMLYAAGAILAAGFVPQKTWDRVSGLLNVFSSEDMQGVDEEGSAEQRYAIWKVARAIIKDYPTFGVGIGTYPLVHRDYARSPDLPYIAKGARDTHSTYLNTLAETGAVGLTLLATAWLLALWRGQKAVKIIRAWAPDVAAQYQFLRFAFVGFLVGGIWGTYQRFAFMWVYVGLMYTFEQIYVPMAREAMAGAGAPPAPVPAGGPRRAARA
jgi:O-antigen ligase